MKNALTTLSDNLTMSSREIAELCEKEHRGVLRDVDNMLKELEIQSAQFCADYKDGKGRTYRCFNLPKDLTLTLIAGYNVKLRKRIIDRWQELENQIDPMMALNDPNYLRIALLTYSEKVIELTPKAEAFDRLSTETSGSMNLTNSAKHLQMQPKAFNQYLSSIRWIYKRGGSKHWIAYQDKLQQGLLEHKIHTAIKEDGSEKVCEQVLLTAKGLAKIASLLNIKTAA